jgi:hypothetical protein
VGEPSIPPVPVEEVRVLAPHREVGETTVRREDTRSVPGAFGDPTRIAETLPGIVPSASGLQAFFVRGAPPTGTGYFIDEVPIPALYHVGFGPSVVHPALIDHVDLFQGAAPVRFGRFIGGTIAATTASPEDRRHAEANLRLFDAGALAETPLAEGRGTALAAARYGYPGLVVPLFAPDVGLSYWDYQARVTWTASERDRIGAFVFGSYDLLTQQQRLASGQTVTNQLVADQFHRADVRWDRALGVAATMRVAVTLGRDLAGGETASGVDDIVRLRAQIDARPSSAVRVRGGVDVQADWLRPGNGGVSTPSSALVPSRDTVVFGAHADAAWRVSPNVEVIPGVRVDLYKTIHPSARLAQFDDDVRPALDPRLAARARISRGLSAVSTIGLSHQLPGLSVQNPEATPLLDPGIQEGIQTSMQMSQGIEVALPWRFALSSTVFLHDYFGLPDLTAPCSSGASQPECITPSVSGRAYGLELLLRRPFSEAFTVWIAYTLSRSTRQARPWWSDVATMTIPSEYDRTHVLSVIASYELGARWRVGARLFAYSGRPYTEIIAGLPATPYNGARLPGFYRVDVRIEKSWMVGQNDRIAVVLEGMNVTLNKEAVSASCGLAANARGGMGGAQGCTIDMLGPIVIPSIGIEAAFR